MVYRDLSAKTGKKLSTAHIGASLFCSIVRSFNLPNRRHLRKDLLRRCRGGGKAKSLKRAV
jgi:hypothetical protein